MVKFNSKFVKKERPTVPEVRVPATEMHYSRIIAMMNLLWDLYEELDSVNSRKTIATLATHINSAIIKLTPLVSSDDLTGLNKVLGILQEPEKYFRFHNYPDDKDLRKEHEELLGYLDAMRATMEYVEPKSDG